MRPIPSLASDAPNADKIQTKFCLAEHLGNGTYRMRDTDECREAYCKTGCAGTMDDGQRKPLCPAGKYVEYGAEKATVQQKVEGKWMKNMTNSEVRS